MVTGRMEPALVTDQALQGILAKLREREPLFHRREIVASREDFERERYEGSDADEYETERWTMADEQVREVAPHTYLLTYTLRQGDRVTRRLTVWQGSAQAGWKVLYHQGAVVS